MLNESKYLLLLTLLFRLSLAFWSCAAKEFTSPPSLLCDRDILLGRGGGGGGGPPAGPPGTPGTCPGMAIGGGGGAGGALAVR